MQYDIVVIGGGSAGLSFGCSLAESGIGVLILERQDLDSLQNPKMDGRDFANTHLSKKVMQELGVWQRIPAEEIAPLKAARVVDGDSDYALRFDTSGRSIDELGYLISNHVIRKALYEQVSEARNVEIRCGVEVTALSTNSGSASVTLSTGEQIETEMVVSADSRFSGTRRMMGISADMFDFGRTAIVCRVTHEKPHHETAYECFRYSRTLALLPLNGNRASVVITVPSNQAKRYMEMTVDDFNTTIEEGLGGEFGRMELEGERFSYPLVAVHANHFVGTRYALLGDAAVGMHPVTAHGFNLGLRGQNTLATAMKSAISRGEPFYGHSVLGHYERQQMVASRPIYHGTNAIVRLFTNDSAAARLLRKAALRFGNNFPPVQWAIIHKLTEVGGTGGIDLHLLDGITERIPKKFPKYSTR
ncbi:MAG: 5-demethoxyubiquinol-8 5-hydroxylase UbiM [Gammaproteobacteria bacterium]|uniref:5-demethoxyubiquinol-8 5-hydroxylase UbiM n=1 Tax=Candidatus Thiopontia autotrophica TaxID=2841688 RepID=A0A8J6P661_9GAMM|nr:5-demethoxyubiquinol-8 5-hydroxylase UbiM [Candidatus Thiopontia autotrophica]MBL6969571.1 5-demethoxyubiquinol-8 5-hydroxylase UbiM [Gammaproteobacteria bacterium]